MRTSSAICGAVFLEPSGLRGHAYDAADLSRRLTVELFVDGWPADIARADGFAPEAAEVGDGYHGFGFRFPEMAIEDCSALEVRLANSGEPVGEPIRPATSMTEAREGSVGHVTWAGGLRLTGWVEAARDGEEPGVRLVVERRSIAEAAARDLCSVIQGTLRRTMASFDIRLPMGYADGRVHVVTVVDRQGRPLAGSPCSVLAFPDDLRDALLNHTGLLDGDPRAELIDRILPQSVPFSSFSTWEARHLTPTPAVAIRGGAVAVVLVGESVEASVDSLDAQADVDWMAIQLPEAGGPGRFRAADFLMGLQDEPHLAAVCVALAGTRFRPGALARFAAALQTEGSVTYSDALVDRPEGPCPLLWPVFDPERQLEQGYAALAFAAPVETVTQALRQGVSSIFDLFWAIRDGGVTGGDPIHLPEALVFVPRLHPRLGEALAAAGVARTGAPTTLEASDRDTGLPLVHVARPALDNGIAVAVIQPEPFAPELERLSAAIGPLVREPFVVSHRAMALPAGWRALVVPGGRNPSRLRNAALAAVSTDRLLLLDAGIEPLDIGAVGELAGRFGGESVAAAGGLLLSDDGIVMSAGVVLGPGFAAAPAFEGLPDGASGHAGTLRCSRNSGALASSCLMLDCTAARAVGAFDEFVFPELYSAIDLSLRLRAAGAHLTFAPRARFVARSTWHAPPATALAAERDQLRRRWGEDLLADPFYHPGLNLDAAPFTGLAWPPRGRRPRRPSRPRGRAAQDRTL